MSIFRKSSLEKLSSPEQLDKMIVVTSPASWLAVLGAFFVAICVALWAFFGTIPSVVSASGVFVSQPTSTFVCFVPLEDGKKIKEGMGAVISDGAATYSGKILSVEPYVSTRESISSLVKNDFLLEKFSGIGPSIAVEVSTTSTVNAGTIGNAKIIVSESAPINLLIPGRH